MTLSNFHMTLTDFELSLSSRKGNIANFRKVREPANRESRKIVKMLLILTIFRSRVLEIFLTHRSHRTHILTLWLGSVQHLRRNMVLLHLLLLLLLLMLLTLLSSLIVGANSDRSPSCGDFREGKWREGVQDERVHETSHVVQTGVGCGSAVIERQPGEGQVHIRRSGNWNLSVAN